MGNGKDTSHCDVNTVFTSRVTYRTHQKDLSVNTYVRRQLTRKLKSTTCKYSISK